MNEIRIVFYFRLKKMQNRGILFLPFYITLLVFGCHILVAQPFPFITKIPNLKSSEVKKIELSQGIHDVRLPMSDGPDWQMKVSIPEITAKSKVPLIIALHWAGNENTYREYFDCLAFPALKELGAVIVAPSSGGIHWIDTINEVRLIQLVRALKKHLEIDKRKVVITGYSNGGIAAWQFADKYPQHFKSAIPIAGIYNPTKFSVPLIVIHGSDDDLFPVGEVSSAVSTSVAKGSDITLVVVNNHTHLEACNYVPALQKAAKNLSEKVWRK
jgi:poly(3-hydroxybutyrate) depolymerase